MRLGALAAVFAALGGVAQGRGGVFDARHFDAFDVYSADHRVLGLRLDQASVLGDDRDAEVVFDYGRCVTHHEGCRYELELIEVSMCRIYPDVYYSPPHLEPVNGARGGWIRTAHSYDVYTGKTAITILGVSRKEAHRVGKHLRNARPAERADRLPAPRKRFLRGDARCQHGAGRRTDG